MALNILFGPPKNSSFLSYFFSIPGRHVVCGGSTAQYVANFLHKSVVLSLHYEKPEVPPISKIDGVDLVTEGIVTMNLVLEKFLANAPVDEAKDGASLLYKELIESEEVYFFVGTENPANKQYLQLKSKGEIVIKLSEILLTQGKKVMIKYV